MKLYYIAYRMVIDRQITSYHLMYINMTLDEVCAQYKTNVINWPVTTEEELRDYLDEINTEGHEFILLSSSQETDDWGHYHPRTGDPT